jgi:hypothetical protein
MALINKHPHRSITNYSHPLSIWFFPYGSLEQFKELLEIYEQFFQQIINYSALQLSDILNSIEKHIVHLPHYYENHRIFFIKRQLYFLKKSTHLTQPNYKFVNWFFINTLGISKPPSLKDISIRLLINYIKLRYLYGYSHTGALFHIFFRRKIASQESIAIVRNGNWPLLHLVGKPNDPQCIIRYISPVHIPWTYTSKKGFFIRKNVYLTSNNKHIYVNSEILSKWFCPKMGSLTINSKNNAINRL